MKGLVQQALRLRSRISTYFYSAVGLAALTTILMIAVAWQSFERIDDSQQQIVNASLPAVVAVVRVSKLSSDLVAAAPKLVAAESKEEVSVLAEETGRLRAELQEKLSLIQTLEHSAAASEFSEMALAVDADIGGIESSMLRLFELRKLLAEHRDELAATETQLRRTIIPLTDDQFFFLMTGRSELGAPPSPRNVHFTINEVNQYRHISLLEQQSNIAMQLLIGSAVITDVAFVRVRSELFEAAIDTMSRSIELISDPAIRDQIKPLFANLVRLGTGEGNGFDLKEQELRLLDSQAELVAESRIMSARLAADAERLVTAVTGPAKESVEETAQMIRTSRTVIITLGILGIIGAALIVWQLIGRSLMPRLQYLSQRMRRMGKGELDDPVEIAGKDEIADMAAALEIFRKSALDAQRLNIVEELSRDLLAKNTELQSVLDQLKSAQSQIVMREKLAALGELTAGVAHEIKNPLNFVTNFSDASRELIEELEDVMGDRELDDSERQEEIESICQMLSDNVGRIRDHGARAVRIVDDMLRMGRGGGAVQETDINQLVEQNAKLAFHGARASTENFQVKLSFQLDPDAGTVEIVSQDIGRVLLNLVGNSCYATHKKRMRALDESGGKQADYVPELRVTTERTEGQVLIIVYDNGSGIPADLREKIFNPFFTTKPTDEGTGLGLALCNDIIQKHGGEITMDSQEGEYTKMTVMIPENAGKILAETEDQESEGSG